MRLLRPPRPRPAAPGAEVREDRVRFAPDSVVGLTYLPAPPEMASDVHA